MGLRGGGINADRNIMTLPFSGAKYEHRNRSQKFQIPRFLVLNTNIEIDHKKSKTPLLGINLVKKTVKMPVLRRNSDFVLKIYRN